jgi:hypothetical protein
MLSNCPGSKANLDKRGKNACATLGPAGKPEPLKPSVPFRLAEIGAGLSKEAGI